MTFSVNLSAYFARIAHSGPTKANLETLDAIALRHVQSIPFENLDILRGLPISIEPAAVEDKLVHQQRGGYCFEHNTLLLSVLEQLGFQVSVLGARARYQLPPGVRPPRTHMLLRVEIDGRSYLVDGGFGGLSPTAAVPLILNVEHPTPHEPRRIVTEATLRAADAALHCSDAVLVHQAYFAGAWHDVIEFNLDTMPLPDREMGNWYTSTFPASHFRSKLMVARATANGRLTLQDRYSRMPSACTPRASGSAAC